MKRAIRRHHAERLKAKAKRRIISRSFYKEASKEAIGKYFQVHGTFCSGFCCGNPRRFFKDKLTIGEKRNLLKWHSEKSLFEENLIDDLF